MTDIGRPYDPKITGRPDRRHCLEVYLSTGLGSDTHRYWWKDGDEAADAYALVTKTIDAWEARSNEAPPRTLVTDDFGSGDLASRHIVGCRLCSADIYEWQLATAAEIEEAKRGS